jgi:ribose/xylose/arabinose/galactoside ABC-type transport system permease subunit
MGIYRGIAFVQTNGQSIGEIPEAFRTFTRQEFNGLTLVPMIVMIIVMIIGGIVLSKRAVGRKIYAIGGNETASRYNGIRVGGVKIRVYTICGITAGIAAVLSLGYYGAASCGDGQGFELDVIAAAVVGGTSLVGGKGTALGALLGAVILQMISSGLVILNIPLNYSQIVIGLVVIAAVLSDQLNASTVNRRLSAGRPRETQAWWLCSNPTQRLLLLYALLCLLYVLIGIWSKQYSEMIAITAACIGGASVFCEPGTILGSAIGASIIGVLLIGLAISNVSPSWQLI